MKFATRIGIFLLAALLCLPLVACADVEISGVWENATYTSEQTLGEGSKTVTVVVTAEEQSLTLTLRTDKETLGDALREHGLIEDDNGLINAIIGIEADWNNGGWWWKFTQDGVMMMEGADTTVLADGAHYEFTRTNSFD